MGLGIGFAHVSSSGTLDIPSPTSGTREQIDYSATYNGWGPALELLIGGTVARGFVIGGGFVGQDLSNPKVTRNTTFTPGSPNVRSDESMGIVTLGPFVDWFPDEHGGLHFGAMAGFGLIGLPHDGGEQNPGVAGSLWGGYDFWVADQWSLGLEARAVAASANRQFSRALGYLDFGLATSGGIDGTLEDRASSFELLFTALYH